MAMNVMMASAEGLRRLPDAPPPPLTPRDAAAVAALQAQGHCVVDGFLDPVQCELLRRMAERLDHGGALAPGETGIGGVDRAVRNDYQARFTGKEPQAAALRPLLQAVDALLQHLSAHCAHLKGTLLEGRPPMVASYRGGRAHYSAHYDLLPHVVTCILYLNPKWEEGQDGGHLVLHPGTGQECRIAPCLNRLVVFWAGYSTLHAVAPTNRHRYAVTMWFDDADLTAEMETETETEGD